MSLFPKTYQAWHRTATLVRGEPDVTYTEFSLEGSVQPVTGRDLQALPAGRFDLGSVKVYTLQELVVGVEGSELLGDVVEYHGVKYEIIQRLPYYADIITHNKYVANLYTGPVS